MAHFARINEENIVEEVVVIPDDQEDRGQEYLDEIGLSGRWIQTSITGRIRKVFAQRGYLYLEDLDIFKPNKPEQFPSFVFDDQAWDWVPPIPMPESEDELAWDEDSVSWVKVPKFPKSWINGVPPVEAPKDGKTYYWNEPTLSWVEVVAPQTQNIHYWDPDTLSWVDTGMPIPEQSTNQDQVE